MSNNLRVSIFKCLDSYESRAVSLDEVVWWIGCDNSVRQKQELYLNMVRTVSKQVAKKQVKEQMMPAFSVGVLFGGYGRKATDIVQATGLAMCDIDNLDEETVDGIKLKVCQDPHTIICYKTISRRGVRAIFSFRRVQDDGQLLHINCEAYPAAWKKGNEHYRQLTGVPYDKACSDYSRLSGMAHDADVYYNKEAQPFDISDQEMLDASNEAAPPEAGKPRKVFEHGSQQASANEAWIPVQRIMNHRGYSYSPGHRHDYLVQASYLFCRFGVDREELKTWAAQEWCDMPQDERDNVIAHCYKNALSDFGTWRVNNYSNNPNQEKRHTLMLTPEIRAWLEEHYRVYYNLVTDLPLFRKISDASSESEPTLKLLDERETDTMRCLLEQDTGKRVQNKDLESVLKSDFSKLMHPIRDYMNNLPDWDGQDRIAPIIAKIAVEPSSPEISAEDTAKHLAWGVRKWLVGTVATWLSDDKYNPLVLVFIGKQGINKTTFFRHLLPPEIRKYFWENSHNSFSSRDDKIALTENCLVEIEEIDAFSDKDMAEFKSLITTPTIKERRIYARYRTTKSRLASFCASGNTQRFLTDTTGNRRWLCYLVSQIENPRQWELDYKQLYAQLKAEYLNGFQYWTDKAEEEQLEIMNEDFRVISREEELINARLAKPDRFQPYKRMSATMISIYLAGYLNSHLSVRKIGEIMRRKEFPSVNSGGVVYYLVVQLSEDEAMLPK